MVASPPVVESSSRLGLLRRSPSFAYLFLATAGSSVGTYLAAVALTVDVYDETGSGVWVAALLIADFLPIVLVGLLLGPLVDRLSRRRLMIVSDLVRCGVFAALPFVDSPAAVVGLAAVSGVATGFFVPAGVAGLPNLVPDEELTNANSLIVTIETLAAMIGPVLGGIMLALSGTSLPYAVNAVTFLVSAALIARIPRHKLQSDESLSRGHWRDVADGLRLVVTARPLRTVLVVWNVVILGAAAINVAEVVFAKDTLGAGNLGFGALVAASGVGLVLGSFLAPNALGKAGLRRAYVELDRPHGRRLGCCRAQRLDLARGAVRDRGRGWQRRRGRLQPASRTARGARPVSRASARDDHELELRRPRARDGGGRRLDRHFRRSRDLVGRRVHLPRRLVRRVADDTLASRFADRRVGGGRGELRVRGGCARVRHTSGVAPGRSRAAEPRARPEARTLPEPVLVPNGRQPIGLERIATLLEEIEARRELEAQRRSH